MKLLCLSSDLRDVAELVEALLRIGIRCAVHEYSNSQVGVWVQQDTDLSRGLQVTTDRQNPRPLPPWASLLGAPDEVEQSDGAESEVSAPRPAGGTNTPSLVVVRSEGSTRTGTRRFFRSGAVPGNSQPPTAEPV